MFYVIGISVIIGSSMIGINKVGWVDSNSLDVDGNFIKMIW